MINEEFSLDALTEEFPLNDAIVYLNHAAVAPWPLRTAKAVEAFAEENIHYGASHYKRWVSRENQLRQQIQTLINAPSPQDIALLKNTSEALSVVACGINWLPGDNIVTTDEEFPSNRIPWEAQQRLGVNLREVRLNYTDPERSLIDACDGHTRLMTVSSVQYGSGIVLDLERLGTFCRERGILFCIDAIQSLGALPFDAQANRADFVMADAHKWLLGPEGIAIFYSRKQIREQLDLYQYGWHMVEQAGNFDTKQWKPAASGKRFECGSNNMLGIHALSASLSLFTEIGMQQISRMVLNNTSYLIENIKKIKGAHLITPEQKNRHAGIVTFWVEGHDSTELYAKLMDHKVICACRLGGVRFSPHFYTPRSILDKALDILNSIL